jgi:virulence-associated protein VapD
MLGGFLGGIFFAVLQLRSGRITRERAASHREQERRKDYRRHNRHGTSLIQSTLETLGFELSQGIVFDGVADLKRVAADLTVFDIAVTVHREVQNHRDLFAAKGTGEGVFHDR